MTVGNLSTSRTNSTVSDDGCTTLTTQPSDVINTSMRLSTLYCISSCLSPLHCYNLPQSKLHPYWQRGCCKFADNLNKFLGSLYHIGPLSPYLTSRIAVFNFSAILGDASDMNRENGLDERPKWQDATEGDLRHEQAVGTTVECY